MSLRFSLRPLARQITASISQSKAPISSTTNKSIKLTGPESSNVARDLLWTDKTPPLTSSAKKLPPSPAQGSPDAAAHLDRLLTEQDGKRMKPLEPQGVKIGSKLNAAREALARQVPRRWREGDTYNPHDLSVSEMMKWKKMRQPSKDVFDLLGLNPLDHYKNFAIISEYMTDQGRIKPSKMNGLRPVNQRKIAKAIRRAIGMGIHPSTHRHPEILFNQLHSGPRHQNSTQQPEPHKKFAIK